MAKVSILRFLEVFATSEIEVAKFKQEAAHAALWI